jgi:F-type H+-transporting ATPase subunit a
MIESPLNLKVAFQIGPVPVSVPVVTTWALIAALAVFAMFVTHGLSLRPGRLQAAAELLVDALDSQARDTMRVDPAPYRALFGAIFLFVLLANWSSLIPGVEPPTARLETDAALALIVFVATIYHGLRVRGVAGYLKSFAEPTLFMVPLNLVEQITRTFSLVVRLFGNVMSGVFIVGIVLSLAGLLVPIPLMALDLLTGAVQAYIFTTLAMVFVAAAISGEGEEKADREGKAIHGSD